MMPYLISNFQKRLHFTGSDRPFDLGNSRRDLDLTRASIGAVKNRPTAPNAKGVGHNFQPLRIPLISGVKDEAVSLNNGRRSNISSIRPKTWARRSASSAKDTLCGVIKARAIFR